MAKLLELENKRAGFRALQEADFKYSKDLSKNILANLIPSSVLILFIIPSVFSIANFLASSIGNFCLLDSMFSFVITLSILIVEPITGYLADLYSIKFPFLLIAVLLTAYSVYY